MKRKFIASLREYVINQFKQESLHNSFERLYLYDIRKEEDFPEIEESDYIPLWDDVDVPASDFNSWTFVKKEKSYDDSGILSMFCDNCEDYQAHKVVDWKNSSYERECCYCNAKNKRKEKYFKQYIAKPHYFNGEKAIIPDVVFK